MSNAVSTLSRPNQKAVISTKKIVFFTIKQKKAVRRIADYFNTKVFSDFPIYET